MNSMCKCNGEDVFGCAWSVGSPPSTQAWIKQYLSWVCEAWLIAHRVKNALFGQHCHLFRNRWHQKKRHMHGDLTFPMSYSGTWDIASTCTSLGPALTPTATPAPVTSRAPAQQEPPHCPHPRFFTSISLSHLPVLTSLPGTFLTCSTASQCLYLSRCLCGTCYLRRTVPAGSPASPSLLPLLPSWRHQESDATSEAPPSCLPSAGKSCSCKRSDNRSVSSPRHLARIFLSWTDGGTCHHQPRLCLKSSPGTGAALAVLGACRACWRRTATPRVAPGQCPAGRARIKAGLSQVPRLVPGYPRSSSSATGPTSGSWESPFPAVSQAEGMGHKQPQLRGPQPPTGSAPKPLKLPNRLSLWLHCLQF